MALKQYITGLRIKNYRQFRSINLNFCDPESNEPLEKICFIGSNGTGKSTLLDILSRVCQPDFMLNAPDMAWPNNKALVCWRFQLNTKSYLVLKAPMMLNPRLNLILPSHIENTAEWHALWDENDNPFNEIQHLATHFLDISQEYINVYRDVLALQPNSNDLAIHSTSEEAEILAHIAPDTNLSNALKYFKHLPEFYTSRASENQSLSVADARQKFDAENPGVLQGLAKQWNLILDQAGLELDVENAKIPIQLNENLGVYIRLQDTDTMVEYNLLSAGIRNFIFRLGHIYTLYFNRQIDRGFLFLDEPEQSLYPDFLYDIIELFVATHSEIVAAQFKPAERICLHFKDDGSVSWRRGVSPEGDDPNDVLLNDFSVRNLYGKEGVRQWHRYLELRQQIVETDDAEGKMRLMDEYLKIGNAYNFAPNEIPE